MKTSQPAAVTKLQAASPDRRVPSALDACSSPCWTRHSWCCQQLAACCHATWHNQGCGLSKHKIPQWPEYVIALYHPQQPDYRLHNMHQRRYACMHATAHIVCRTHSAHQTDSRAQCATRRAQVSSCNAATWATIFAEQTKNNKTCTRDCAKPWH
jgi:hypothetical protein